MTEVADDTYDISKIMINAALDKDNKLIVDILMLIRPI